MARSRYPSLQVPMSATGDLRAFLEGVKERLEITTGDRGDPRDRLLTVRDIESAGMATVTVRNKFATLTGGVTATAVATLLAGQSTSGTFDGVSAPTLESIDLGSLTDANDFITYNNDVARLQRVPLNTLRALFLTEESDAEITGAWQFQNEDLALELTAQAPRLRFTEIATTDDPLPDDAAIWDWLLEDQVLTVSLVSDDEATSVGMFALARDGLDPAYVALLNDTVLRLQDGTLGAPGVTFDTDLDTGLHRISSGRIGVSANGVLALDITGTQTFIPSGSAGSPALPFQADIDTGPFRAAADAYGIATAGVERLRVNNSGLVVSGTAVLTAITGHLDVTPSSAVDFAALKVRSNAGTEIWRLNSETDGDLDFSRQSGTGVLRVNAVSVNDAALFTTGTLDDARLSSNVPLKNTTNTFTLVNTFNSTPVVPNQSWTYAKIQDVSATARVLGRATAGAGVIEELTAAQIATLITYTAADVLAKLLTVDGAGSGLDADLLDGISSAGFFQTSAVLLAVDGAVGAPAYSYASDPDSGMYRVGSNNLGFTAGGTLVMRAQFAGTTRTLVIGDGTGTANFTLDGAAGGNRDIVMQSGSSTRWVYRINATAESGSNVGSDFELNRRDDVGVSLGNAVRIMRATGQWLFEDGSAAAPELSFAVDTDTGIYRTSTNSIAVSAGGVDCLKVRLGGSTRIVTIGDGIGAAAAVFDGPAGNTRDFQFTTAGLGRWILRASADAESGSNAGTNFQLLRRDDTGAALGTALTILRSTGQWRFEDGTAALPQLSFTADSDTGIYRVGANILGFSVNATEVVRIQSTGLNITGGAPGFGLVESDVTADEQVWRTDVNSRVYRVRAYNDALTLNAIALAVTRGTGSTPTITDVSLGNATDNPTTQFLGTGVKTFGGALQAPDGTASLPAYSLTNDPDCGMYRVSANVLGFAVAATDILRVVSTGFDVAVSDGLLKKINDSGRFIVCGGSANNTANGANVRIEGVDYLGVGLGGAISLTTVSNKPVVIAGTGSQLRLQDGTVAIPGVGFSSDTDCGLYRIGTNSIALSTNGVLGLGVDATQRVYGTALHNNSSSPTGTASQYIASGTYTPTLTSVTNVAASTAFQCQWMRVGNVVTVSGRVSVDPTAAGATILGISLPLASNLGAIEDCAGVAFANAVAGQGAAIWGDATNDRASMEWVAIDVTNQGMSFIFTYEII